MESIVITVFVFTVQTVKPHVPLIKFRKGLPPPTKATETTFVPAAAAPPPPSSGQNWTPDKVVNLEWWQTPDRFKRRLVDESEIDIINVSDVRLLALRIGMD